MIINNNLWPSLTKEFCLQNKWMVVRRLVDLGIGGTPTLNSVQKKRKKRGSGKLTQNGKRVQEYIWMRECLKLKVEIIHGASYRDRGASSCWSWAWCGLSYWASSIVLRVFLVLKPYIIEYVISLSKKFFRVI